MLDFKELFPFPCLDIFLRKEALPSHYFVFIFFLLALEPGLVYVKSIFGSILFFVIS